MTPYEGATPEQLANPNVQHFLQIHEYFRAELANLLTHISGIIDGKHTLTEAQTQQRIHAVISASVRYTHHLHTHHGIESQMLFPSLHKMGLASDVVEKLEREHDEIAVLIDSINGAIRNVAAVDASVMENDLRRLGDALREHLAYEETRVCPLLVHWSPFIR